MEKETQKPQATHGDSAIDNKVAGGASPALVVGIGAGAGALKSLGKVLGGLSSGRGMAVILIHHPELTKKNLLKLLKGQTALEVVEAADGMAVFADRIYVMSPEMFLSIAQDRLALTAPVHCDGLLMPIDHFFCSLAADRRKRCCGVLLSGGGGDGTLGLSEIRAAGGRAIVENPKGARFPDMPKHAIGAGMADAVLPAKAIGEAVNELAGQTITEIQRETAASPEMDAGLEAILDILCTRVGHDFRCYKPGTLMRRIRRRMALEKIATMEDYSRYLSGNPNEIGLLQNDLLIGVTDFFRQPQAWEILENRIIAQLLDDAAPGSEIRVWVPGCSTGKEVYSLAILLAEAVEKRGDKTNFQIFATDADIAALAKARTGGYTTDDIGQNISAERLNRFFSRRDGRYRIVKSIRERVVFASQNITSDPPFSRLDLIICRNLLIYLDQQVQRKIIALFHFALRDGGFLFLGNAETIGDQEDLFEPVSKKWRIYRRIGVGHRVNVEIPARSAAQPSLFKPPASVVFSRPSLTSMAQQILLDRFAPACVMIDRKLHVLYVHGMIENYLTIPAGELTTRIVDMAREGLRARMRGSIDKCIETGRTVAFTARTRRGEKSVPVKATVSPLKHLRDTDGLLLITFEDQRFPAIKSGRQGAVNGDVRQLADELKITREELQSTIDQLEGSNDQLKASNEEVMAANEELQSANEEMETSKEELHSLNEELNTINVRLQEKVDELESTNNDVINLLASASIATLFLDKGFRIKRYTPAITRMMSLIPTDLGRPFADILLRFTDGALMEDARRVLIDLSPLAKEVRAEDGRWYIRRITPYRTHEDRIEGVVLTFVDVTDLKKAQEELDDSRRRLAVIVDSIADGFFAIDLEWRFTHINDAALRHFGKARDEMLGRRLLEVFPATRGTAFETGYRHALESGEPVHFEAPSTIADRIMEMHAYPGRENLTVLFRDITGRHRLVEELRAAHERAAWLARFPDENPVPVMRASAEGTILYHNPASAKNKEWACNVGDPLPAPVRTLVAPTMASGKELHREIQLGEEVYAVTLVPFPEESYVNVYGRAITKRKKAEEALRRSEERLKRAQDIAHLGSWELDLIDKQLVWSDEVYRIFGLEPQAFAATYEAFLDRVHPDDREAVDAAYSRSIQENWDTYEIEHRVIRDTGEIRFVHERCHHYRDESGRIVRSVGMVHDITERKRAEEALRKLNAELEERVAGQTAEIRRTCEAMDAERQRFYNVLELLPAYVVLLTPDYYVPFANRFFRERFGESQGKRCYEYLFQRTAPCDICETYTVLKTGKPHHWDWIGPDCRNYDVYDFPFTDSDGAPFILEMGIDVTEIKRAEGALREINETLEWRVAERTAELEAARAESEREKRLLETVMDALPVGVAITDAQGGTIKSNRTFELVWGGPRPATDSVEDYADYKAWWPETGEPVRPEEWASARAVQKGEAVSGQLLEIRRFDGSRAFVLNSGSPVLDAEGKIVGSAVAIQDITTLRRAEEALENRSKQLEAANMELESFSYSVSHDLRAPLRAIDGYSRMILKKHGDKFDDDAIGKFNVIRENTRMMGQLIDDLLAFSRLGRAQLSAVTLDINALIREVWEELKAANPDRRMMLKIGELPPCRGDRVLIKQVFVNILANAVKFTRGREEALIDAGGYHKDGEIVYSIRDDGVGFDMRYYDKLFGVFQRLHGTDEFEGTGVGLAIVQRIVHRHGGRIWAEAEIDRGACFYFSLPVCDSREM